MNRLAGWGAVALISLLVVKYNWSIEHVVVTVWYCMRYGDRGIARQYTTAYNRERIRVQTELAELFITKLSRWSQSIFGAIVAMSSAVSSGLDNGLQYFLKTGSDCGQIVATGIHLLRQWTLYSLDCDLTCLAVLLLSSTMSWRLHRSHYSRNEEDIRFNGLIVWVTYQGLFVLVVSAAISVCFLAATRTAFLLGGCKLAGTTLIVFSGDASTTNVIRRNFIAFSVLNEAWRIFPARWARPATVWALVFLFNAIMIPDYLSKQQCPSDPVQDDISYGNYSTNTSAVADWSLGHTDAE